MHACSLARANQSTNTGEVLCALTIDLVIITEVGTKHLYSGIQFLLAELICIELKMSLLGTNNQYL